MNTRNDILIRIGADNRQARRAMAETGRSAQDMGNQLRAVAASLAGVFAAGELAQTVDTYSVARGQIDRFAKSAEEATRIWEALFAGAQRAGSSIEASSNLFGSLGRNASELGASLDDVLKATQAVQAAGALGATTAAAQAGAIFQLSQTFGGATVQMAEYNSLVDGLPELLNAAATAMGKTRGEMDALARSGGLSSKEFFGAILKASDDLQRRLADAPDTIGRSLARIGNAWIKLAGETAKSSGAIKATTGALDAFAAHLEDVLGVAVLGAVAALGVGLGKAAAAGRVFITELAGRIISEYAALRVTREHAALRVSYAQAELAAAQAAMASASGMARLALAESTLIPAQQRLAAAQTALNTAMAAAGPIVSRLQIAMGFLGGPIGAVTTALTLGATAWAIWGTDAESAAAKAKRSMEDAAAVMERFRNQQKYGTGDAAVIKQAIADQERLRDELESKAERGDLDIWGLNRLAKIAGVIARLKADLAELESAPPQDSSPVGRLDAAKARAIVLQVEREMSLPTGSLLALWQVESSGGIDTQLLGRQTRYGRAVGVTQVLPSTAAAYGVEDISKLDFKAQIELGAKILKDLLGNLGTLSKAFAGYNAGPSAVELHGGIPPFAETQKYVREAMRRRDIYLAESGLPDTNQEAERREADKRFQERERLQKIIDDARAERQKLADELATARDQYATLTGTETPEQIREAIARQYRELLERMAGDAEATQLINKLIDVRAAAATLEQLEQRWRQALETMQQAEQSANVQAEQGLISNAKARDEIAAAHAQAAAEMEKLLPLMEKAAQAIGPEATARVMAWKNALAGVKSVVSPLAAEMETLVGNAFTGMFSAFVSGTQTAKQAFASFARSVIQGLAQIAAQEVWKSLFLQGFRTLLGGILGGGGAPVEHRTLAQGGYITGPGSGTSDSIPAMLSTGEYVVRSAAVRRLGVAYLDAINGLRLPPAVLAAGRLGYAAGGLVTDHRSSAAAPGDNYNVSIAVDASGTAVSGDPGKGRDLARQLEAAVRGVITEERRPGGLLAGG